LNEHTNSARDINWLSLMCFAFPMFQGLSITLVPLRMASMGLSETSIGLVQALPGLMVLALGAPFAQMANTRWRSKTLVLVFALVGTSSLFYGYAETALGLIVPQLLMGISTCAFYGNMLAVSFQLKGGPNQGAVQGRITAFQGLGVFAGPLLGGWLLQWGAVWAFLPGVLCALIGAAAAAQLSPSQDMEERPHMTRYLLGSYGRWLRVMRGRPTVQLGMVLVALSSFLFYLTGGVFYLVYASSLGVAAFWAAGLMSGRELLGGLVRFSFGVVAKRFGALLLLVFAIVLGALALAFLPLVHSLWGLAAIALALGIAGAFVPPGLNVLAGATAAPQEQSFAILCLATGHFCVQTLTAPLVGALLATHGYESSYPLIGLLWVALALVTLKVGRGVLRRRAEEETSAQ
jgi:MFS family permease